MPWMFGNAAREHMKMYGSNASHYAWIGYKNHKHSVNNPYSQFRDEYTEKEVSEAPMIYEPLTKLQCSPTSDGAAAAVLMSEDAVKRYGFEGNKEDTCINAIGADMCKKAADAVYKESGLS